MPHSPSVRVRASLGLVALLIPAGLIAGSSPTAAVPAACSGAPHDINGDGYADVAVGEPSGGASGGGRLHVFYGTAKGLATKATGTAPNDQVFAQDSGGLGGTDHPGNGFGWTTLVEDLNADGCADVVAAAPFREMSSGVVYVLYGSPSGLSGVGSQMIDQDFAEAGAASPDENFGALLAAGDLNDDGVNDLAVGSPGDHLGGAVSKSYGAVTVLYGSTSGFTRGSGKILHQNLSTVPGKAELDDWFGSAVAVGDLTGDGIDDLIVGVPGENMGAGIVQVLPGSPTGIGTVRARTWSQKTPGVPGRKEEGDGWGRSLAVGDVDGDGGDDLVVGAPGENEDQGAVTLLRSNTSGKLSATGARLVTQNTKGVAGVGRENDSFGSSVAVAPLDSDGYADVVIGTPEDTIAGKFGAGSVTLMRGAATGWTTAGYGGRLISQKTSGVAGRPGHNEWFGYQVATSPVQGKRAHNVLVGIPLEDVGSSAQAGQILLLRATGSGPKTSGSQTLGVNTPGVAGVARTDASFGAWIS